MKPLHSSAHAGQKNIRVLIADDHAIVRAGLRQIIADTSELTVAGESEDGLGTIRMLRARSYDVVLLDISLPDKNGIDVLKQIKSEYPKLPVLMLSMYREDQYAIRALKAGASGYLNKQSATAELVDAVHVVASGRKYITPALAQELARQIGEDSNKLPHENLSDREFQTMILIASGNSVTDIANTLTLSVKTISMYRSRLLQKMHLRHNGELTYYAMQHQLVC